MTYMTHKYMVTFNTDNPEDFERAKSIMEVLAEKSDSPCLVDSITDEIEENDRQFQLAWDEDHADYGCNNPHCALCNAHYCNVEE